MTAPLYPLLAAGDAALAEARVDALKRIFGDRLYVAVERHGMDVELQAEPAVIDLAYRFDLPLVATNEPFFPRAEDFEAHDALLAIAEGRLLSSRRPPAADAGASFRQPRGDDAALQRSPGSA